MPTKLIIGLGNPGARYSATRHNAGFMAVDALAKHFSFSLKKKLFQPVEIAEGSFDETRIVLAKPTTFMNLSGKAVIALVQKYRLKPTDVIVLSDDVDLPLGTVRVRQGGSAGGHNGLKSVMNAIGPDFVRIRLGVGSPPVNIALEDYVLTKFAAEDMPVLERSIDLVNDIVENILRTGLVEEQTKTL